MEKIIDLLSENQVREIASEFKTPVFVYSEEIIRKQANEALNFPNAYGLTVRYAMKANSNAAILGILNKSGIEMDASSGFEVERAIEAGIPASKILLTSQQIPDNLKALIKTGISYNACSIHQLEEYGKLFPGSGVSVRINPGLGSGGTNRTNTGGPASSFGIWHEQFDEIMKVKKKYNLNITRIHTHIGSGSDPEVWKKVALMSLEYVKKFIDAGEDIKILNLGGGYKVARMPYEKSADLQECGKPVKQALTEFYKKTGKKLKLEIEPGTFLIANAGFLISKVMDIKKTSKYNFIIIDSGMTEITRPALYGAQHPIRLVSRLDRVIKKSEDYIVSGHCCESGDILTPAPGDSESLMARKLPEAEIGDFIVIGGAGAYCSSMCTKNYNSYPESAEVLLFKSKFKLIRKRQALNQLIQNEI